MKQAREKSPPGGGLFLLQDFLSSDREIERENNVPLTASKGSLSEGAVSRRLTEGVPKGPADPQGPRRPPEDSLRHGSAVPPPSEREAFGPRSFTIYLLIQLPCIK